MAGSARPLSLDQQRFLHGVALFGTEYGCMYLLSAQAYREKFSPRRSEMAALFLRKATCGKATHSLRQSIR